MKDLNAIFEHFVYLIMTDSAYLYQLGLRAFSVFFQYFAGVLETYCRCAIRTLLQEKLFFTNLQRFKLSKFWTIAYTECQKSCTIYIFAIFSQIEISFEILKLILTYVYKSLYFKVCPSNFSFVFLSLQLNLEKPFFLSILIVN